MNEVVVKELIPQLGTGDPIASGLFYDLTKTHVYRTVYFLYENKDEIDDVTQEVYYQLFKSLKNYDDNQPFKPWLTAIIIKQVSNARRKKWRFKRVIEKILGFYTPNQDQLANIIQDETNSQLLKKVERLSPKLKEVIFLKYINQLSQEEIAHILGIPIGTVKSRINSALIKLRGSNQLKVLITTEEGKGHGF
jgi:RNA polymerase sigma-70 factor, ECF subfamily